MVLTKLSPHPTGGKKQTSGLFFTILSTRIFRVPFTWCIEMNTIEMPIRKFIVNLCPNSTADAMPVKIVATVDEYFFKIVSATY